LSPALQLFLSRDGTSRIRKGFEVDQFIRVVLPYKVAAATYAVLPKTPAQFVCDSDVQDRVSLVREDVDEIILMPHR
jgi:hypothetical protein